MTEPDEPGWIGATKHSNNTGELTALFRALERAEARDADGPAEEIWTDSLYARNMTLGLWKTRPKRSNTGFIKELRAKWRSVQAKRGVGTVRIEHVRSHIRVPGNELADRLAGAGKEHATPGIEWAHGQMRAFAGRSERPPGPPGPNPPPHHLSHTTRPRLCRVFVGFSTTRNLG